MNEISDLSCGLVGEHLVCADLILKGYRAFRTERGVLRCLARMVTGKTAIKKGSNER